jgi:hypothetical protein
MSTVLEIEKALQTLPVEDARKIGDWLQHYRAEKWDRQIDGDISESAWTKAAATTPAFDFLKDAAEDIYTAADGKPFHDQG